MKLAANKKEKNEVTRKIEVNGDELILIGAFRTVKTIQAQIAALEDSNFKKKTYAISELREKLYETQDKLDNLCKGRDDTEKGDGWF